MSKWTTHENWCLKSEISYEVSDYMQRAVDSKGPSDKIIIMPADFIKHCEEKKIIWAKHKNLAIVDLSYNLHDRGKVGGKTVQKIIQAEDLKFLLGKGADYVKAYYIHFILDYLNDNREWLKTTGESIVDRIDKYKKKRAVLLPETEEFLICVTDFLKSHSQEIKESLKI